MGRVVVITGGTSGIGLALKNLFVNSGDTVLTFSLEDTGAENHYVGSVSHEIKVKQVFNDIYEKYGKIDVLINNAGVGMSGVTELVSTDDIQKLVDINYFGTLYCTRSALPHMTKGAKIINMSSAMALFPVPFRSIYGSVKSAVLNLSFGLRMELAPLGIDVVAICPGDTKTNFTKNRIKDFETNERYGDRVKTATEKSDAREDQRMAVEDVATKIFKYINLKRTKPFYIIGGKYKFLYFLTRFTSKALLLKCTAKTMDGVMNENTLKPKKEKVTKAKKVKENEPSIPVVESGDVASDVSSETNTIEQVTDVEAETIEKSEESVTESEIKTEGIEETEEKAVSDNAEQQENTEKSSEIGSDSDSSSDKDESASEFKEASEEKSGVSGLSGLLNKMTGLKKTTDSTQEENTENE